MPHSTTTTDQDRPSTIAAKVIVTVLIVGCLAFLIYFMVGFFQECSVLATTRPLLEDECNNNTKKERRVLSELIHSSHSSHSSHSTDASYDSVVLLRRWEGVGYNSEHNERNDSLYMSELVKRHALYFPRGTRLIISPVADTTDDLVHTAERLLKEDNHRVFVGVLTSGDLLALKPLAQKHPDAIFISTASTAPTLALPDNVLRLACPDNRSVRFMGPLLDHTFSHTKKWIIQFDSDSQWARQLHDMLRFHMHTHAELQVVHSWKDVNVALVKAHTHHLGIMSITEDDIGSMRDLRAQPWFDTHLDKTTPIVFSDASAFSRRWSMIKEFHNTKMPIYAFTSLKMLAAVTIAQNVLGHTVGPFLANLLLAGRLGVQALVLAHNLMDINAKSGLPFHGRQVIQQVMESRHTSTGTGMFDDNGDRADIEVGIVQWRPQDAEWRIVSTAGKHHALGKFDATFYKTHGSKS